MKKLIICYREALDSPDTTPQDAKALTVNMRTLEKRADHEREERAGREATRPTPMSSRGLLDTTYTKQAEAYMNSLEAQLAAQPSVQRDEDGIGWCSSCDKIHEVARPKCPSCGDWLIFAADDKPEESNAK